MSQGDPDQLALPLHPDDGDQQELIRSAQQHLAALRTARRLGVGVAANRTLKQKDVEIVGLDPQADAQHHHGSLSLASRFARVWRRHGHAASGHDDEQEVDDSWFRVDDEEARRTVKLSIGKVPKRAAALVGRTVSRGNRQRRSRRERERGGEMVSDDGGGLDSDGGGGGDRYELKGMDTAQRGGNDTFARRNKTYTHRHHHLHHLTPITTTTTTAPTSENEDAEDDGDSFVTLELPARFGTIGSGGGGMGGSNAAFPILGYSDSPNGSLSRIVSPASPSSRSATLFPVDSIASGGGGGGAPLSTSGSTLGTPLYNNKQQSSSQQQILTVDEVPDRSGSSGRPKISRKTTALTMTSGSGVATPKDKDKDKDKDRDDDVDASSRVVETAENKSPRLSAHRKLHKHHRPASNAAKHHHDHPHHPHYHRHHHHHNNKGKDLAAETSGATAFELQVAEALKKAGVIRDEEERVESDVLWEHQRGLVVFGLPKFSGNALFQADPPHWCDASFKPSPFNPHTFPCKPYWVWRDSEFMIDMAGDKDEEGWSYAFRFRSHYWRGEPQPIRSFVRRRRWIRTRVYRPEPLLSGAVTHAHALRNALGLAEVAAHPELGPCGANPSRSPSPSPAPSPCGEPAFEPIHDLRTACAALPIADDEKVLLFADSSSPAAFLPGGAVDPRNPFVSFRQIKTDGAANMSSALAPGGQRASELEPLWREAVREINYRRAIGVLRARTRVDRQRVELFRLWFGEYDAAAKRAGRASVGGGDAGGGGGEAAVVVKADGTEGAHETAQKEGAKAIMAATKVIARKERSEVWDPEAGEGTEADVDDVWDVVEHRLDDILLLFDYQLSRQTFLTMLLDIHPVKHAYHRYRGYDASSAQRKATLERGLEARLVFYETAMELVRQYGGKGGWMPEPVSLLGP